MDVLFWIADHPKTTLLILLTLAVLLSPLILVNRVKNYFRQPAPRESRKARAVLIDWRTGRPAGL